jgi:methylmalonyl-CoA mutase N-terminal domain/subunit
MLRAIEAGLPQRAIAESAFRHQREVEAGERLLVGVNAFRAAEDPPIPTLRVDEGVARAQVERLRAVRAARSPAAVDAALAAVERAARRGDNVMPPLVDAVKALATLGELSDVFRRVFGRYREEPRL